MTDEELEMWHISSDAVLDVDSSRQVCNATVSVAHCHDFMQGSKQLKEELLDVLVPLQGGIAVFTLITL